MNRINKLFQTKKDHVLSVYFTAGHPALESTVTVIKALQSAGADMIEIGIPFSDPMADGPVIQESSSRALKNGMSLRKLFAQISNIRQEVEMPLLLMGYLNPVLQYGIEKFCKDCRKTGIDGIILPDLPLDVYCADYKKLFFENGLANILLITPQTSDERIRFIDEESSGFIYMVSSSSTTGMKSSFTNGQIEYFSRIKSMNLNNPVLAGFGISNHETFETTCSFAHGAIIGSAFVKMLAESSEPEEEIKNFIKKIRNKKPAEL
jgi:tryptophan synthase alpha chain